MAASQSEALDGKKQSKVVKAGNPVKASLRILYWLLFLGGLIFVIFFGYIEFMAVYQSN